MSQATKDAALKIVSEYLDHIDTNDNGKYKGTSYKELQDKIASASSAAEIYIHTEQFFSKIRGTNSGGDRKGMTDELQGKLLEQVNAEASTPDDSNIKALIAFKAMRELEVGEAEGKYDPNAKIVNQILEAETPEEASKIALEIVRGEESDEATSRADEIQDLAGGEAIQSAEETAGIDSQDIVEKAKKIVNSNEPSNIKGSSGGKGGTPLTTRNGGAEVYVDVPPSSPINTFDGGSGDAKDHPSYSGGYTPGNQGTNQGTPQDFQGSTQAFTNSGANLTAKAEAEWEQTQATNTAQQTKQAAIDAAIKFYQDNPKLKYDPNNPIWDKIESEAKNGNDVKRILSEYHQSISGSNGYNPNSPLYTNIDTAIANATNAATQSAEPSSTPTASTSATRAATIDTAVRTQIVNNVQGQSNETAVKQKFVQDSLAMSSGPSATPPPPPPNTSSTTAYEGSSGQPTATTQPSSVTSPTPTKGGASRPLTESEINSWLATGEIPEDAQAGPSRTRPSSVINNGVTGASPESASNPGPVATEQPATQVAQTDSAVRSRIVDNSQGQSNEKQVKEQFVQDSLAMSSGQPIPTSPAPKPQSGPSRKPNNPTPKKDPVKPKSDYGGIDQGAGLNAIFGGGVPPATPAPKTIKYSDNRQ